MCHYMRASYLLNLIIDLHRLIIINKVSLLMLKTLCYQINRSHRSEFYRGFGLKPVKFKPAGAKNHGMLHGQ